MVQLYFDATAPIGAAQPEPQPAPKPGMGVIPDAVPRYEDPPGYRITQSSPEATHQAQMLGNLPLDPPTEPPYWELKVGESIAHRMADVNVGSLRVKMSAMGRRMGKRFSVLVHQKLELIEVARIK